MGHFPFEWLAQDVSSEDFNSFHSQFSRTILQLIPFAEGPVTFLDALIDPVETLLALNKPKYWLPYIKRVLKKQRSTLATARPILFLPVWSGESIIGIGAVEAVDEQFAHVLSEEWLSDRSRIISREFFLLKQQAIDPVTGMFNGYHLNNTLRSVLFDMQSGMSSKGRSALQHATLILLEMHPRANNAAKALHSIVQAGYYLESFLGQDLLHHLGNGIFGFIGKSMDEEQARKTAKDILGWCRREGFHRAHLGMNSVESVLNGADQKTENFPDSNTVFAQTWESLRKASRRGPFAFCAHSSIKTPEKHPLKKIKPVVLSKLRKLWTDIDRFAIALVRQDRELYEKVFSKRLLALIEPRDAALPLNERETIIFLKGADEKKALAWADNMKKKLSGEPGITYSMGLACFPCIDFKQPDIPQNARKALLHAGFFGPDSTVLFDSVSQNVSGDIFYEEGDLVRAVGEYKKGLAMEPLNTNLLNSLGEAYAQMNKPKKAGPFFESVLKADPKHYMALYNLGVTSLIIGKDDKAIGYFEQALKISRRCPDANQVNDLLLQLGKLYCRTGRYKKAVSLLEKQEVIDTSGSIIPGRNILLRYLGEAYLGAGRNNEAVKVLQHAIRHNPHDASALSMLGELYALENQGDDIALSLCEQAVNIDDRHWKHWYRLALVRYKIASFDSSLEALQESLRRNKKRQESLYLAGQVYVKLGDQSKAATKFEAVLKITPDHVAAKAALIKLKNNA